MNTKPGQAWGRVTLSFQEIVETYGRRGQHFLRDVWEEWEKKKEGRKETK